MRFFDTIVSSFSRAPTRRGEWADIGPTVKPLYEIKETDEAYGLTVYLPGVAKNGVEITVEEGELRLVGRRAWKQPEGWTTLYRESEDVPYELILEHETAIDTDKIHAELNDGILRIALPKAESVKPRKITVN
ncbi:MAG: Hsp20/alpha crystallin family protein [Verrucomicrobiota bacterium]|nr:Hsp20/alpha crystallin family protein [Verrucomicrobiota bacterium]